MWRLCRWFLVAGKWDDATVAVMMVSAVQVTVKVKAEAEERAAHIN